MTYFKLGDVNSESFICFVWQLVINCEMWTLNHLFCVKICINSKMWTQSHLLNEIWLLSNRQKNRLTDCPCIPVQDRNISNWCRTYAYMTMANGISPNYVHKFRVSSKCTAQTLNLFPVVSCMLLWGGIEKGKEIHGTWSAGGRHGTEQQREPSYTKKQHEPPGCRGQREPPGLRAAAVAAGPLSCSAASCS